MMEERIIVTTIARKDWAPKRKKKEFKNVTVIFGDPSKPDPLKPLCVFDDDDFYTIDQLKDALHSLDGYQYTYLNNHDTLYNDLVKTGSKTDFFLNLCDEGFNNEPRKELHVPALLETLNLPYTGGGPQCLAFCYDKSLVRGIAKEMDISVAEAFFIRSEDSTFELPFGFPVIAKLNFGDSSFGITQRSVANSIEKLVNAITEILGKFGYEKPILVEEFLTGTDLTVGIIGNPKILEVNPNHGWCWDGHLAKMSKLAGLSYSQMLAEILRAAEDRLSAPTHTDKELAAVTTENRR